MINFPLVHIITVSWNACSLLRESLQSIRAMTYPNQRIIVVDNGSQDDSVAMVQKEFPEATLIENGENLGFGGGNNIGLQYALDHGAEWFFLLNNDIGVDPDLLSNLMQTAASYPKVGIFGPKIYFFDQPDVIWFAGATINFCTGIIAHRGLRQVDQGQFDQPAATDYVTGCAMLIRRDVLQRIGLFDPVYHPAYAEDVDLCARAQRAGYELLYVPTGKLWHKISASSGGGLTPFKTRLKVRNSLIFFKRYARWYHWLTIPIFVGFGAVFFVIKQLAAGNFKVISALAGGFSGAIKNVFKKSS